MKKYLFLSLVISIALSTCALAGPANFAATDAALPEITSDPDARVNLNPTLNPPQVDDGRAFGDILLTIDLASAGMPGDGYDNAGLTWDGTYLYIISMYDNKVYVIDPTTQLVVTSWNAAAGLSWGFGHETNLWMTEYNAGMAHEFTFGGSATGATFPCVKGGASWMGDISEWWAAGEIWILAVGGSNKAYKFTVPAGTCIDSIGNATWTSISQRGFSYDPGNNVFFVGGWNDNILWEIDDTGAPTGRQVSVTSLASIAYDWQSSIHPTPVIWAASNEATNRIFMLDADNPNPPPPENILYVDDDEDDVTETYWETSFNNFPYPYDKWVVYDSAGVSPDSAAMSAYTIVVWSTGGDYSNTLTGAEITQLGNWLNAGGKLWLSSQDVLYDYGSAPWMHITGWTDDIGCANATGIDIVMSPLSFPTGSGAFTDFADIMTPDGTSWTSMINEANDTNTVAMDTTVGLPYFLYFNTFGWENIVAAADRDSMMQRVLTWMGYAPPAPPSHDVATTAIITPNGNIMPSTVFDPQATFANVGGLTDTFDIYFEIDSSGTPLYSSTTQMILPPAAGTTYTFAPTWTSGPDGVTYDVRAYTVLTGDANTGNDTLITTATTKSAFWKIYATMPQTSYYNAAVYTDVTGTPTAYSLGGNLTYTSIFEFDCSTETWSTSSYVLNHEAQRTAAAVVGGKIYVMGGCDAGFTAHAFNQEYDPVAGTVIDMAALPTARYFSGALAWNDSLIYVIGGQASSYYNVVEIYDPASDTWTTGTALPIQNRSFACGISGDTIYVTGGYNGSGYVSATYIGVIDSANPTSIAWATGPTIPMGPSAQAGRSRLQGACVLEKFYFTCGDDHGVAAYDTWYYDPADQTWHQDLDKPTPISNSQCAVFVPTLDSGTFFCAGGYNTATSAGTNATEGLINLVVGISEEPYKTPTLVFGLSQNAPNPTRNGYTAISYTTTTKGSVSLKIYNSAGRLVRTLINNSNLPAGTRTVYWDMKDNSHNQVSAGVYFYRLSAENRTISKKMVVVK